MANLLFLFLRQIDGKAGSLAGFAADFNFSAMQIDNFFNDGKPQTGAALAGGEEWFEHTRNRF